MKPIEDVGKLISLEHAAELTAEFRKQNPNAPLANLFGKKVIHEVLRQQGAEGIRIYYGIKPDKDIPQPVLVAVDSLGNDIVPGLYADRSEVCPPVCSNSNLLNGLP